MAVEAIIQRGIETITELSCSLESVLHKCTISAATKLRYFHDCSSSVNGPSGKMWCQSLAKGAFITMSFCCILVDGVQAVIN